MIPKYCIEAIIDLFDLLLGTVSALPLPNTITEYLGTGVSYIVSGMRWVACYIDVGYIMSLLAVVIAVDAGLYLYKFGMWIIKKIPFLGVN